MQVSLLWTQGRVELAKILGFLPNLQNLIAISNQ